MNLEAIKINRRQVAAAMGVAPIVLRTSGAKAQDDRPLRVRMTSDISQLDPAAVFDPSSHYVAGSMYSRLVRYKPGTTEIEPDLATEWAVSEDGLEYVFTLRNDAVWHKGYGQVTANDVKFSVERHLDPESRSLFASYYDVLESVEALDDTTVKFTLKQPFAPFVGSTLAFRSGWIVNQRAIEEGGDDYMNNPIGSGPYQFDSWDAGRRVVLVANTEYFEGAPSIKRVEFIPIAEDAAAELAVMSKEIDLCYFNVVESYLRLQSSGQFITDAPIALHVHGFLMNMTRPPYDNVLVRRAIAHAIDREGIIASIFQNLAELPTGFLTPNYFGYSDNVEMYDYDPDKARELLAEAGLGDGFDTSILYNNTAPWPQMVPIIQANLKEVGINLELIGLEFAAYQEPRRAGDYDIIVVSTSGPADPDLILTEYFHSRNFPPGVNSSYYDQIDSLIEEGRLEQDTNKRKDIYERIQQQMAIDSPGVWTDWDPAMMVHTSNIEGHAIVLNYDLNPQTIRFTDG